MKNIVENFTELLGSVWQKFAGILLDLLKFVLAIIFQFVPLTTVAHAIKDNLPGIWNWAMSLESVKKAVSTAVFRKFGNITIARPHRFTMAADYTTWNGLVDRTFSGRHLGVDRSSRAGSKPDIDRVVDLFVRGSSDEDQGRQIDDIRSSLLFASVAQWFTDSFLRTSHAFDFDDDGNVKRDENNRPIRLEGREKTNDSNHEIDLCQIYGLNEEQTGKLRLKSETDRGCLRFQLGKDGEYPEFLLERAPKSPKARLQFRKQFSTLHPDERVLRSIFSKIEPGGNRYETIFAVGLEHGNATIGNSLLNVIFLREHNRVARLIAKAHPDWDDEQVFQKTRNTMIVLLLKIIISDYIRHISPLGLPLEFRKGVAEKETWYRSNRIHIEFNILYRWHGLVPDQFSFMPEPADPRSFLHNNNWLMETGVANAVSLFSAEPAGRMVLGNTPRFLAEVKRDTMQIIRASHLASYNDYRERFSLPRAEAFEDITDDPDLIRELKELYHNETDEVEWYVGMCAEKHERGMIMGELMFNMVAHDAFTHALTNPLLSNQVFVEDTFSDVGWKIINTTKTLEQIVGRVVGPQEEFVCDFAVRKS